MSELVDLCGRREGGQIILPPGGVDTVVDEAHRLRAENERLREALQKTTHWWMGDETLAGAWRPDIVAEKALRGGTEREAMDRLKERK